MYSPWHSVVAAHHLGMASVKEYPEEDFDGPLLLAPFHILEKAAKSVVFLSVKTTPRARDFPNPHDGEMKSDPAEKLYETPTKKTMILMK